MSHKLFVIYDKGFKMFLTFTQCYDKHNISFQRNHFRKHLIDIDQQKFRIHIFYSKASIQIL